MNSESKSSDFADSNQDDLMKPDDQHEQPTQIDPNIMEPPAAEVETQKMPKQAGHAADFGESISKRSKAERFDLAADDAGAGTAQLAGGCVDNAAVAGSRAAVAPPTNYGGVL